jgi:hypothetical protein
MQLSAAKCAKLQRLDIQCRGRVHETRVGVEVNNFRYAARAHQWNLWNRDSSVEL